MKESLRNLSQKASRYPWLWIVIVFMSAGLYFYAYYPLAGYALDGGHFRHQFTALRQSGNFLNFLEHSFVNGYGKSPSWRPATEWLIYYPFFDVSINFEKNRILISMILAWLCQISALLLLYELTLSRKATMISFLLLISSNFGNSQLTNFSAINGSIADMLGFFGSALFLNGIRKKQISSMFFSVPLMILSFTSKENMILMPVFMIIVSFLASWRKKQKKILLTLIIIISGSLLPIISHINWRINYRDNKSDVFLAAEKDLLKTPAQNIKNSTLYRSLAKSSHNRDSWAKRNAKYEPGAFDLIKLYLKMSEPASYGFMFMIPGANQKIGGIVSLAILMIYLIRYLSMRKNNSKVNLQILLTLLMVIPYYGYSGNNHLPLSCAIGLSALAGAIISENHRKLFPIITLLLIFAVFCAELKRADSFTFVGKKAAETTVFNIMTKRLKDESRIVEYQGNSVVDMKDVALPLKRLNVSTGFISTLTDLCFIKNGNYDIPVKLMISLKSDSKENIVLFSQRAGTVPRITVE